jgi:hypothetical protein
LKQNIQKSEPSLPKAEFPAALLDELFGPELKAGPMGNSGISEECCLKTSDECHFQATSPEYIYEH